MQANDKPTDPQATTTSTGRDGQGRFAKGNLGGPGNPFNRRMAQFRKAMIGAVSDADVQDIIRRMVMQAQAGDTAAAKLVLAYVIGKPTPQVEPDRLDLDEWQLRRARPSTEELRDATLRGCKPDLANILVASMDMANLLHTEQLLDAQKAAAPVNGGKTAPKEAAPVNGGKTAPKDAAPVNGGKTAPKEAAPVNGGKTAKSPASGKTKNIDAAALAALAGSPEMPSWLRDGIGMLSNLSRLHGPPSGNGFNGEG